MTFFLGSSTSVMIAIYRFQLIFLSKIINKFTDCILTTAKSFLVKLYSLLFNFTFLPLRQTLTSLF